MQYSALGRTTYPPINYEFYCLTKCESQMKKLSIFLTMFFLIAINSCEKNELNPPDPQPREIREFLNSPDWTKYECSVSRYGMYSTGTIQKNENDETVQMFLPYYIYTESDTVKVAELQIVKMEPGLLPDGDIYFINLIDFTRFDLQSKTGNVSMYGVNFENFLHDEYLVIDNIIQTNDFYPMPDKYLEQQVKGINFFACYRAIRNHYDSIDVLKFLCDFDGMACWMAASGSCLYLMAMQTK